jgi:hypothetical protein
MGKDSVPGRTLGVWGVWGLGGGGIGGGPRGNGAQDPLLKPSLATGRFSPEFCKKISIPLPEARLDFAATRRSLREA